MNNNTNHTPAICPGSCNACTGKHCYSNNSVAFRAHGNGVKLESGRRAVIRYQENVRRAMVEVAAEFAAGKFPAHVRNTTNSKTGGIPTINQPALLTCSGRANAAGGCGGDGFCYAIHGRTSFYPAVKARVRNYMYYRMYPDRFLNQLITDTMNFRYARYSDSGDIADAAYFEIMVKAALANPGTIYSTMTKKFEIVNNWISNNGKLPENLVIMFSGWTNYNVDEFNPYHLPVASVID